MIAYTGALGYMGYTKHKMPQIGRLRDGSWYCQGFCGHGMCSTVAGAGVAAAAVGAGDETYNLFEPFGLDYAAKPFGPVGAGDYNFVALIHFSVKISSIARISAEEKVIRPPVALDSS